MNHLVEQVWLGAGLTQQHDDGRVRVVPGADVQRCVANLRQTDGQTALNVHALHVHVRMNNARFFRVYMYMYM